MDFAPGEAERARDRERDRDLLDLRLDTEYRLWRLSLSLPCRDVEWCDLRLMMDAESSRRPIASGDESVERAGGRLSFLEWTLGCCAGDSVEGSGMGLCCTVYVAGVVPREARSGRAVFLASEDDRCAALARVMGPDGQCWKAGEVLPAHDAESFNAAVRARVGVAAVVRHGEDILAGVGGSGGSSRLSSGWEMAGLANPCRVGAAVQDRTPEIDLLWAGIFCRLVLHANSP